jgi:superfamily II DNA or RNA helicase
VARKSKQSRPGRASGPLEQIGKLLSQFSPAERERGRAYFEDEYVDVEDVVGDVARGLVYGSEPYVVEFDLAAARRGHVSFECSCPAFARVGSCKHGCAFLLYVFADGMLEEDAVSATNAASSTSSASAAHHERAPLESDSGVIVSDTFRESRTVGRPVPLFDVRAELQPAPPAPLAQRLARLRDAIDSTRSVQRAPGGGALRLRLLVDREVTRKRGMLVVVPLEAPADAPDQPTAWKPLHPSDVDALDPLARMSMTIADQNRNWRAAHVHARPKQATALVLDSRALDQLAGALGVDSPLRRLDKDGWTPVRVPRESGRIVLAVAREGASVVHFAVQFPTRRLALWNQGDDAALPVGGGWLLAGDELVRVADDSGYELLCDAHRHGPVVLPAEGDERLVFATLFADRLEEPLAPEREPLEPRPHVRFEAEDDAHWMFVVELLFDYDSATIAHDAPEVAVAIDGQLARRDSERENAARALLASLGVTAPIDVFPRDGSVGHLSRHLAPGVAEKLVRAGWRVEVEGRRHVSLQEARTSVTTGIDWFGVRGVAVFDGEEVPLPELLEAARQKRRWIELKSGARGHFADDDLAAWRWLELGERGEEGEVRFQSQQGWLLDALLAQHEGVDVDAGFRRMRTNLARLGEPAPLDPPKSFVGELRPYQREGLGWLTRLGEVGLGGCLADDMGLGKTVQVLAMLEARRARRKKPGEERRPTLLVVPRTLIFNWLDEARRFTPKLTVATHHGPQRWSQWDATSAAHLVLTTYGTLRLDSARLHDLDDFEFDLVVLDEAQQIKNGASQVAKAARLVRAKQRLALTGTPIENRLEELWSLLEFLNPGMVGSAPAFKRLLDARTTKRAGEADGAERADTSDTERRHVADIARAVQPFFLRRTKQQVLPDLPPKTEQILHVELEGDQRTRYDEVARHYRSILLANRSETFSGKEQFEVLTALLRLRQLACHPGLVDPKKRSASSAKLDVLLPRLEELAREGHKAVVFSQFTTFLDLVAERLDALSLPHVRLDGSTTDRKTPVARFQTDPAVPIFLASLKAGGTGLNLTAADFVFLLDPWWNPAAEAQAVDRAHRLGRTRPVHAYRLVAKDTIEERVLDLQATKRELAAALFDENSASIANLSRAELERLLA